MGDPKIIVPSSRPDIDDSDIACVVETLKSGWITTGPRVRAFESALAAYLGLEHAVCLSSATAGMELVLRALGIGCGDEVITTAYTYAATANVIRHTGARAVLADTLPDDFAIDPKAVAAALSPRTKAIIPVDFAGWPCDYAALAAIAEEARAGFQPANDWQEVFGRPVILADAAHSLGSRYAGMRVPLQADFMVYSFHAVKNLTTAEGGAVAFRASSFETAKSSARSALREGNAAAFAHPKAGEVPDRGECEGVRSGKAKSSARSAHSERNAAAFAHNLRLLALHGQSKDALAKMQAGSWEYDIEVCGYKHNMTDMQAALGIGQLARYDTLLRRRKAIAERYRQGLAGARFEHPLGAGVPEASPGRESSFHLYPLRIAGYSLEERNELIARLASAGIAANVHYKPLPLFTAYKDLYCIEDFPHAYAQYVREVTLPLWAGMSEAQIEYVISKVNEFVQ
jgi:dTDP-4-amino-4,6-dideoxygalactose transaminase